MNLKPYSVFWVILGIDYVTSFVINTNINKNNEQFVDLCPNTKKTISCASVGGKIQLTDAFIGISSATPPVCVYNNVTDQCIYRGPNPTFFLNSFKPDCDNKVSCEIFADTFGFNIASCGNKPPNYLHIDFYCKDVPTTTTTTISSTTTTTILTSKLISSTEETTSYLYLFEDFCPNTKKTISCASVGGKIQLTDAFIGISSATPPVCVYNNVTDTCIYRGPTPTFFLNTFKPDCDNKVSCEIFADTFGFNIASCGNKPPNYLHIDYYCKYVTIATTRTTTLSTSLFSSTHDLSTDSPTTNEPTSTREETTFKAPLSSSIINEITQIAEKSTSELRTDFPDRITTNSFSVLPTQHLTSIFESSTTMSSTLNTDFSTIDKTTKEHFGESTFRITEAETKTMVFSITDHGETKPPQSTEMLTNRQTDSTQFQTTIIFATTDQNTDGPIELTSTDQTTKSSTITTSSSPSSSPLTTTSSTEEPFTFITKLNSTTNSTYISSTTTTSLSPITASTSLTSTSTKITDLTTITKTQSTTSLAYSTETQETQTSEPDTSNDSTLTILLAVLVPTAVFTLSAGVYLLYKFKYFKMFTSVKPEIPKTESIPLN